tara:strand:- start:4315 stop:5001 length:687 start_codon:yes stop_codon:yes gene_type:complete
MYKLDYDITITSYCNAACPSCKRYAKHGKTYFDPDEPLHPGLNQVHMNFNEFKSIIERDIELFKYKEVTYEGELGDAMVHPEIKKFIEFGTSIFKRLKIVTNGGVRTPKFYKDLGDNHKNLEIMFSIDGLDDVTNQKYRRNVITKKAFDNMIAFKKSKHQNVRWQYVIFEHNWFEIPEVLNIAKTNNIPILLKINSRPKFRVKNKIIPYIVDLYEKNKFSDSELVLAN